MVSFPVIHNKSKEVKDMKTEIIGNIVDVSSGEVLTNRKVIINNGIIKDIEFGDTSCGIGGHIRKWQLFNSRPY